MVQPRHFFRPLHYLGQQEGPGLGVVAHPVGRSLEPRHQGGFQGIGENHGQIEPSLPQPVDRSQPVLQAGGRRFGEVANYFSHLRLLEKNRGDAVQGQNAYTGLGKEPFELADGRQGQDGIPQPIDGAHQDGLYLMRIELPALVHRQLPEAGLHGQGQWGMVIADGNGLLGRDFVHDVLNFWAQPGGSRWYRPGV